MSGIDPQFRRVYPSHTARVQFTIDGRAAQAQVGDLLSTAILLNQRYLRKFEFGPGYRAGFCLMSACQDCWVALTDGRRVRACDTLVEEGMGVLTETKFGADSERAT